VDTRLRLGLTALKGVALGGLLTIVVGGLGTASPGQGETRSVDDAYQRVVQRAGSDQPCAFDGFDDRAEAGSALIRTSGGDVRVVSFEKGWEVYNRQGPGRLLAVCIDDPRPRFKS
jgi:hypothetical protein